MDNLLVLLDICGWLLYGFQYQFISEILRWRAQSTADHVIFTLLNSKGAVATTLSCSQLHKKAERVGNLLLEKGKINTGDHVALIFPPGIDLICAFYGCLYVGKFVRDDHEITGLNENYLLSLKLFIVFKLYQLSSLFTCDWSDWVWLCAEVACCETVKRCS